MPNLPQYDRDSDLWYFPVTDSTQEEVKRLYAEGKMKDGSAVLAGTQTAGRGRVGHTFFSPAGKGLYLSLLLNPVKNEDGCLSSLTARAAVACAEALTSLFPLPFRIKWVNDLMLREKKLGGILTEQITDAAGKSYLILGVGINISTTQGDFREELSDTATSLSAYLSAPPSISAVCTAVLGSLRRMWTDFPEDAVLYLDKYRRYLGGIGKEVRIRADGAIHKAVILGIDDDYSLRVQTEDGLVRHLSAACNLLTGEGVSQ